MNPMIQLGERNRLFDVRGSRGQTRGLRSAGRPARHGPHQLLRFENTCVPGASTSTPPPGYETSRATYPVLYLLHGSGDTDGRMDYHLSREHQSLDNLIAGGKAKPMIVVMPYGRARQDVYLAPFAAANTEATAFENDLLKDVIPVAEKFYRISGKPDDRAIAGLSMGGGQALSIGLQHLDTFHAVGAFSAGLYAAARNWSRTRRPSTRI